MLEMEFGVSEIQVKGVNMLGSRDGCGVAGVGPVGWPACPCRSVRSYAVM